MWPGPYRDVYARGVRRRLLTVLLLALAGCGADRAQAPPASTPAPTGSRAEVQRLVDDWQRALRAGDAATPCRELLARAVRERIAAAGGDCEDRFLRERIEEAGPRYAMEIEALDLRGPRGTMRVRETGRDGASVRTQPVVREGGRWRLGL